MAIGRWDSRWHGARYRRGLYVMKKIVTTTIDAGDSPICRRSPWNSWLSLSPALRSRSASSMALRTGAGKGVWMPNRAMTRRCRG